MKMKKFIYLLALVLIVVFAAGCGGDTKVISTDKGSVSVNENENKVKVEGKDGSTSEVSASQDGESVDLPSDYPKDLVPIIDGAKINLATRNEDANKKLSYMVAYYTDKEPKEVNTFYQDALKDLTESQKTEANGDYLISGTKNGNIIWMTINTEDKDGKKQTLVTITISPKP